MDPAKNSWSPIAQPVASRTAAGPPDISRAAFGQAASLSFPGRSLEIEHPALFPRGGLRHGSGRIAQGTVPDAFILPLPHWVSNSSLARWIQQLPTPSSWAASIRLPMTKLPSYTWVGQSFRASTTRMAGAP